MNAQQHGSFITEVWKEVFFGEGFTNVRQLQVSNFGRVRSCTPGQQDFRLLRGSKQGGYAIVRFRLLKPRTAGIQQTLDALVQQKNDLAQQIAAGTENLQAAPTTAEKAKLATSIAANEKKLTALKKNYTKTYKKTEKERTDYVGLLVHRLVADFFCKKSSPQQTLVLHKDFNKLNNHYSNLQWATMAENIAHQQHSPYVIAEREVRKGRLTSRATKLSVTKVMLIKKRLLENIPMRRLARQFKVTETQIARIKKGENWKDVPAAT